MTFSWNGFVVCLFIFFFLSLTGFYLPDVFIQQLYPLLDFPGGTILRIKML